MSERSWEKKLEDIVLEYKGSIVKAKTDGRLYYCPLCNFTALTAKDLMFHMLAHASNTMAKRKPVPSRRK